MKIPIKVYKEYCGKNVFCQKMKKRKTSKLVATGKKETPDFIGQVWSARDSNSNIISMFKVLPGYTRWDFQDFPPGQFLPSLKPNKEEPTELISIDIQNNLKTYVNLYMVRSQRGNYISSTILCQMKA